MPLLDGVSNHEAAQGFMTAPPPSPEPVLPSQTKLKTAAASLESIANLKAAVMQ